MTRTISFIIGIAVVALVAIPTAFAEGRLAGSTEPDGVAFFYANERATMSMTSDSNQPTIVSESTPESPALRAERLRSEGLNRKYHLGAFAVSPVTTYKDANERFVEPQSLVAERLRSEGLNKRYGLGEFAPTMNYKDANERVDLPTAPDSTPVASSGREVEWPQIGIGFGIGIALAIVLGLSLKATRPRTLAH